MKLKDFRLDFEAMLSDVVYGHGFLHYGYFPDGAPATPSLQALGAAQQAWFERMAAEIPPEVETILDVGSGTGANALALTARGYRLECLSPSTQLNAMARAKLPETVRVHDTGFEAFDVPRQFDMCLFGESFHYIQLAPALTAIDRYATHSALIFDYFRRPGVARGRDAEGGRRQTHADFLAELERHPDWQIAGDEDVTEAILPTFIILDHVKNAHVAPFLRRLRAEFRRSRPVLGRLAEWGLGRRMDRIMRPSERSERFAERYEYRLIRLVRRASG